MIRSRMVLVATVVLTAVFVVSVVWVGEFDETAPLRDIALIAANTLPLLALIRNPLLVVASFSVTYPLWVATGHGGHLLQSLPTVAAMYALGFWDQPLCLRSLGLITPIWMVSASLAGMWDADPLELGYVGVVFVVVWGVGVAMAGRHRYATQLEQRTAQLEAAQAELARRAVADERVRIARGLHDVVAHAMSVITVQAGVASHLATGHSSNVGDRWV